jgi:primosomal protein N' (replication factor Y) (superfamily II helicase)
LASDVLFGAPLVVRVLPDIKGFAKRFDYLVPDAFRDQIRVGTLVRIDLAGRRVGGWVTEVGVAPPDGVKMRPIAKVVGWGPPAELFALAEWAAWRWAGRPQHLLAAASPERTVAGLPAARPSMVPVPVALDPWIAGAFVDGGSLLRLPPAADPFDVLLEACRRGDALIVCPSVSAARLFGARLRRAGVAVALYPRDWAQSAAGGCVIGARSAAWAPVRALAAVVVLDEHDEGHQQEQTPAWNARDVAVERARLAGVPCVLVSPVPSLESLARHRLVTVSRSDEREGWPVVDIVDRGREEPAHRAQPISDQLSRLLRSDKRIVCVLNTTGIARLLACASCASLARCERCDAALGQVGEELVCPRCALARPIVCAACGAGKFKLRRRGVSKLREELEKAAGSEVVEVTGATAKDGPPANARIYVGTEAVLHQIDQTDVVAFLDIDAELFAPRYRATEQVAGLLARAARLVGGRVGGGRILVQTTDPRNDVLTAILQADPARFATAELARREALRFPPVTALAAISGVGAQDFIDAMPTTADVEILSAADDRWLIRADTHRLLCDALAATPRPERRVRVEVDPLRI